MMLQQPAIQKIEDIAQKLQLDSTELQSRIFTPMPNDLDEPRPCSWQATIPLRLRLNWSDLPVDTRLNLVCQSEHYIRGLRLKCKHRLEHLKNHEPCESCKLLEKAAHITPLPVNTALDDLLTPSQRTDLNFSADSPVLTHFKSLDLRSESLCRAMDAMPGMICYLNRELRYQFVNLSYREYFELTNKDILGKSLRSVIGALHFDDATPFVRKALEGEEAEFMQIRDSTDGSSSRLHIQLIPLCDEQEVAQGFFCIMHDIDALELNQKYVRLREVIDPLTQLGNRKALHMHLGRLFSQVMGQKLYLVMMDLNRFRSVNDSLGHQAGDQVLTEVSRRMLHHFKHQEHLYRLGNDEFVILFHENALDPVIMAERIDAFTEELYRPIYIEGHEVRIQCSFGMAKWRNEISSSELLKRADLAMKHAYLQRKSLAYYTREMHEKALGDLKLESELNDALRDEEIQPYFQPILNLKRGEIVGYEALARWVKADGSVISPFHFITLAESTGQILSIGRQILRRGIRCLQRINRERQSLHQPQLYLSVNVSPVQLSKSDFATYVHEQLDELQLSPELLLIELTEEILAQDDSAPREQIQRLKDMGIRIACDDFGAGYSSLARLKEMPWDIIKIDRSFLASEESTPLLGPITQMAKCLNTPMVVEGVEEIPQANMLLNMGCDFVQGYLYGKPQSLQETLAQIADESQ